ncbi:MAG: hypothetical protein LBU39_08920 [Desulfobulbaceae bacterium]|nr:hypothetical protein [Desulfobulbaceae bacterium]
MSRFTSCLQRQQGGEILDIADSPVDEQRIFGARMKKLRKSSKTMAKESREDGKNGLALIERNPIALSL